MLSSPQKTILITGSNKGIGYTTLEKLLKDHPTYKFIMATRSIDNGKEALTKLSKSVPDAQDRVQIEQLDISNAESREKFVSRLTEKNQKIDALINNAGMAFKGDAFDAHVVEETFKTNFYGTIDFTEKMLNLINDNGKIITVGSSAGKLHILNGNKELKEEFSNPNVTEEQLYRLAKDFYQAVADGTYLEKGYPRKGYAMSKLAINLFVMRVLAKREDLLKRNIQVYELCPGWCRTDMAGEKAPKSAEDGAETPAYLISLPWEINKEYQGQFFYESKVASIAE